MTSCTIKVVLAGDKIETDEYGLRNKRPTLGPGLLDDAGIVTVCKSGPLKHRPAGNTLWIDNSQKRVRLQLLLNRVFMFPAAS